MFIRLGECLKLKVIADSWHPMEVSNLPFTLYGVTTVAEYRNDFLEDFNLQSALLDDIEKSKIRNQLTIQIAKI